MMQDTPPADHSSEFNAGKNRISWKSAEDLSASTTDFVPSARQGKTKYPKSVDILQLSDSPNTFHTLNSSTMPSRSISNPVQPNLQPILVDIPKSVDDCAMTVPSLPTSLDLPRPNSLSVDSKFCNSNDQDSGIRASPLYRYPSGESSDERTEKKLKSRQSSNEGSFERSTSPRDTLSDGRRMDAATTSDSCRSYDSFRSELLIAPPSIKEKDKKESKTDKKGRKAWYNNLINPTYKSRSADLKRLFKELPSDERLIVDYSCALQKDILVHGRLYVTQNFFCFYSKIFGWETYECIRCKEIVSVTKEKTALVIPNALQINTKNDKHFLTSFTARDKTYMILFRCWQNALIGQQMSATDLWQYVHSCYGEELGLTSDDDDYVAPSTEDEVKGSTATLTDAPVTRALKINSYEENASGFTDLSKYDVKASPRRSPTKVSPHRSAQPAILNKYDSTNEFHTDSSDACDSDIDNDKITVPINDVTCPNCITHHVGRESLNRIYGLPIDSLFTLLFTNSKFMLDLHTNRKTTALQCTNWQSDEETNQKIRQVTYTMALPTNSFGPKVSHVTETQVMAPHSVHGQIYSIDAEACNGGIPYADSFYVSSHWCLTSESAQETRLSVWSQVKYKKSVWGFMKSVIEKNSYNGVENMMADLNSSLLQEVSSTQQQGVRRRRRRIGSKGGELNDGLYAGGSAEHSGDLKSPYQNRNIELPDMRNSGGGSERSRFTTVVILVLLLFTNVLLYVRLLSLETRISDHSNRAMDSSLLRIGQAADEGLLGEWVNILQQQEKIHAMETARWKESVGDAADHLKRAEESLRSLQISIPSQQRTKIQSLLHHLHRVTQEKSTLSEAKDKSSNAATASDL